jgi:hypothetical protein
MSNFFTFIPNEPQVYHHKTVYYTYTKHDQNILPFNTRTLHYIQLHKLFLVLPAYAPRYILYHRKTVFPTPHQNTNQRRHSDSLLLHLPQCLCVLYIHTIHPRTGALVFILYDLVRCIFRGLSVTFTSRIAAP